MAPDMMRGTTPLDMNQFSKLFTSARIPGIPEDTVLTQAPARHVLVISRYAFHPRCYILVRFPLPALMCPKNPQWSVLCGGCADGIR
jgi:hypothetical protein